MIVRTIIKGCGGPMRVAEATTHTDSPIGADAVFKWYRFGIPADHWPVIMALGNYSLEQIYNANRIAQQEKPPKRKRSRTPSKRSDVCAAA